MTHTSEVFEGIDWYFAGIKPYTCSDEKMLIAAAASIPREDEAGRSDLTPVSMESVRLTGVMSEVAFELRAAMQPDRSDRFESLFHIRHSDRTQHRYSATCNGVDILLCQVTF